MKILTDGRLIFQHRLSLATLDLKSSDVDSIEKRLSRISATLTYCLDDLGILLAQKVFFFFVFGAVLRF